MRFSYFLLLLIFPFFSFSQDADPYNLKGFDHGPFKKDGSMVDCPRDWMMPRERMDSLKKEVKRLEDKLVSLSETPVNLASETFIKLFEYEYEFRIEAWGEVTESFCASDDEAGKVFRISDSGEATFDQMKVYDGKYLVVTSKYYYLGNCQKWDTSREYYIRKGY